MIFKMILIILLYMYYIKLLNGRKLSLQHTLYKFLSFLVNIISYDLIIDF